MILDSDNDETIKQKILCYVIFFAVLLAGLVLGAGGYALLLGLGATSTYLLWISYHYRSVITVEDENAK